MVNSTKGYSLKPLIDYPSLEQYRWQKHTLKAASWNKIEDYMYVVIYIGNVKNQELSSV